MEKQPSVNNAEDEPAEELKYLGAVSGRRNGCIVWLEKAEGVPAREGKYS